MSGGHCLGRGRFHFLTGAVLVTVNGRKSVFLFPATPPGCCSYLEQKGIERLVLPQAGSKYWVAAAKGKKQKLNVSAKIQINNSGVAGIVV